MRRKQFINRSRRSTEEVDDVLKEIAEEGIDEVDIIMEDITDEIHDLQESIDEKSPCSVSENQVNCNQTVYLGKIFTSAPFRKFIFKKRTLQINATTT